MTPPTDLPSAKDSSSPGKVAERAESAASGKLEELLPRFSLDRRISVLVLVLTLAVLGTVATISIPIELIPGGFSEGFLRVAAPWRDAPPQEVLDKVVMPLEEELATVGGQSNLYSFARTGYGQVFMTFKYGTDMDVAYREVRDRIERAKAKLPDDLQQVFIRKDDEASFPVAMVGLAVDEELTDVYDLLQNEVILPIERIEGVASVNTEGLEQKEILIELDRERVDAAGLNIYEIAQDLQRDNFSMASGNVRAGDRKLLLRSVARYRTPASVSDVLIAPSVRLGDIANVTYDEPEKDYRVRVNSRPAYAVMVMKEAEANTLDVARRVVELRDKLRANPRLEALQIDMIMDQGEIIKSSLSVLLSSGRIGGIFAMLVLFFFLRRFRMSLIIALSIPLSMVVALVTMYFAGETLNMISLLGLMISIGLLVDNSVVVAENIHRIYKDEGCGRREAAVRGAGEIALAITTATLTTIVVFLPVALVEGEGQFFLLRLAIPIAVALAASLLVALMVVPLAVYLTLPERGHTDDSRLQRAHSRMNVVLKAVYERTFGALNRGYGLALGYFLRRRLDLVLILVALFALTQWAAKDRLKIVPMSEDDRGFFQISIDMPRSFTYEETEAWFDVAESKVAEAAKGLDLEFYMLFHRRNYGEVQGAISADRTNDLSPRQITEKLLAVLPETPGIEIHTGQASEAEKEDSLATEVVTLYGEDSLELDQTASDLEELFARVPGVLGIKQSQERQPNELALVLDRVKTQRQGVNPQVLAGMVSYALRGQSLPRVYLGGRDIPVRVRFEEKDRESLAELGDFSVPNLDGGGVPLSSLVDIKQLPSATTIFRRNKQIARRITLELEGGEEEAARKRVHSFMSRVDLPEGVRFGAPSARGSDSEDVQSLLFGAMLSIVFVYLLMGFLFESFLLPLAILLTIPLANLGVTWMHLAAGRDMDFLGLVGVIILIGVVVNNGIVLLDYVNRLRERGLERREALLLATERRFRPIMMTALTTICGMVPLTFGEATRMGLSYKSFGMTLIGGMVTSSLLTLLVVPVFYTFLEDARIWMGRAAASVLGKKDETAAEGATVRL